MSLWKMFLLNDGSMTVNLQQIFPGLTMEVISSEEINISKEENISLSNEHKLVSDFHNNSTTNIIYRKIKFINNENIVLIGESYWNKDIYEFIMKDSITEPIGLVLINKRIEMFKKISLYKELNDKSNDFIVRTVECYINHKPAFILFEKVYYSQYKDIFGTFVFEKIQDIIL